ncbi:hypothetical protein BCR44DRAFT_1423263 [Catenaria anguillulae PL171]|uniref:Uncharacterized protein n=1 Tax=Catenaria anguillulae PL171 TaxID=765915 RepID=A0A1Y2I4I1_9FUNG|nr:hypothetical protein BCR44DRAFT_1423263 [Catenaria anguillulae PL171]
MSCSAISSSVAPSMALSSTSEISSRPASANDACVGPLAAQGVAGGGGLRHIASLERVAGHAYASPIQHLRKSASAVNVSGSRKSRRNGGAAALAANKWNVPTLPTTEDAAQALASSLETIAASPSTVLSFGSSGHASSIAPASSDMSSTNPSNIAHPRPRVRQQAPRVVTHRRSMPPGLQSLMSPRAAALQRAGLIQLGSHSAAPTAVNSRPSLEMTSFSAPVTPTSAVPPASAAGHAASVFSALPGSVHWPGSLASPSAVSPPPHELAASRVSDTSTRSTFATAPTVLQPADAQVWTSSDLVGGSSQVSWRREEQAPQQGVSASSSPSSTKATIYGTSLAN